MVHSRRKGHTRERKIRHRFIAAGWPDAKRGDQSRAGHEESDVCVGARTVVPPTSIIPCGVDIPPFRCEVKDQKRLPGVGVLASFRQAQKAAKHDEIPMAIFHVSRDDDYVFMRLGDFFYIASCGTADGRGGDAEQRDGEPGERVGEDSSNAQ